MVLGRFTATSRPDTCLRGMTKNSSFSCFMVIFISYCPQLWGCRRICMPRTNPYMFDSYAHKLVVFAFYCRFHELLPTVLGLQGDLQRPEDPSHVCELCPKTRRFRVFGHFHELLPTVFGLQLDLQGL